MRQTTRRIALPFCFTLSLAVLCNIAQAQTFTVLHTFTGGADGAFPVSALTIGGPGILYGTTFLGGTEDNGTGGVAFKLVQRGSGWSLEPLYEFNNGVYGGPRGPVTVGPNGALYGTTEYGGDGLGTVFELQPPPTTCKTAICYWNETVLHSFAGGPNDGSEPDSTNLVFDAAGNIYGTTEYGGSGSGGFCRTAGCGTVFELSPSGGGWTYSIIHNFQNNGVDGEQPGFGVILDPAGNLYGTTFYGGNPSQEGGTVFELMPSGGTWAENILYDFFSDFQGGSAGATNLIMDQSGTLYGSAAARGLENTSAVFELTPSQGDWSFSALANVLGGVSGIARDTAGNFYGAAAGGGQYQFGWVFELSNSGGSWTVTDLHDFTGGSDGAYPGGIVVLDSSGNLYGTTESGGVSGDCGVLSDNGCGVVWEIASVTEGLRR